jgi:hypothetical protein
MTEKCRQTLNDETACPAAMKIHIRLETDANAGGRQSPPLKTSGIKKAPGAQLYR